ncbi:MAG: hypothetical protein E6Q44_03645 [Flavobacteriales bacterium]|nr:MAG: hypothetical protein E6Q44_03645 [Flavobacteriales bacterium]
MAFKLSYEDDTTRKVTQISVSVGDGFPTPVESILDETFLLLPLLLEKTTLERSVRGLSLIGTHLQGISAHVPLKHPIPQIRESLNDDRDLIAKVLAVLEEKIDLPRRLVGINRDVLGAYYFKFGAIRIYWMPITLLSLTTKLSIEAITFVTLAHELAHAYSHVGKDIDGSSWETDHFASRDIELIEGIAQYYAERVCRCVEEKFPDAIKCFEAILAHQANEYTAYKTWVEASSGESMRQFLRSVSERVVRPPLFR